MAAPHFHKERLTELMHREIAAVIAGELRDPRIPSIVTITKINIGTDQRNATVFVSIFGEDEQHVEALTALNKAAPFIQHLVASRIVMKHFPKLLFKLDDGIGHTQHIHQLLKEINDDLG
jgi:ribosome-binding factor A